MGTVWIPAIPSRYDPLSKRRVPTIDVALAEQYGELRQIIPIDTEVDRNVQACVEDVVEEIGSGYNVEEDYVLAVGDLVCCAAAVAVVLADAGECNVLRWSKHTKTYSVVRVTA